ncbi:MAG: cupin domain-containing protein [Gammaproteobacteria bacterium]|nr:cupin domain-containing protein [Gammaproteobacteria bacterium]
MLRLPGDIGAADFLARCWQKQPLEKPGAIATTLPSLDADEIAWLATLDDVESRLVFTERDSRGERYRLQQGPFDDATLESLPQHDWTLLVNDVDKHLPDMRRWFDEIPFIPDWRIDDLMVSVAAAGGSVGPHRDNYDVFLCQNRGTRRWSLARHAEDDPAATDLSLVKPFTAELDIQARESDVLYLPPGYAHWGVAEELSITFSIGMRAPAYEELLATMKANDDDPALHVDETRANRFYADPDLDMDEARPGFISARSVERARQLLGAAGMITDHELQRALGSVATSLKPWLVPETTDDARIRDILAKVESGHPLDLHGMSRIAWLDAGSDGWLFVNGRSLRCPSSLRRGILQVARHRRIDRRFFSPRGDHDEIQAALSWLAASGAVDPPANGV